MMTWQDPVALVLAAVLLTLALWWRHRLLARGAAPHCTQCTSDRARESDEPRRPSPPVTIEVKQLRLGRRR